MSDSKPVDVLAVMDEAAADLDCQCGHPRCGRQRERARMLDARAAVAELIETVDELADWVDGVLPGLDGEEGGNSKLAAVRDALAACTPAKGDAP